MSTKRHGEKIVTDLFSAIIWLFDGALKLTAKEVRHLLPNFEAKEVGRNIARLRRAHNLKGSAVSGYQLSEKGQQELENLRFQKIISTEPWDQYWRLISYDIAESNRLARDSVRRLIKQLGCRQLQLSLWAHPYPCNAQFEKIRETYRLSDRLILLEVRHNEQFADLLTSFRKTYPQL